MHRLDESIFGVNRPLVYIHCILSCPSRVVNVYCDVSKYSWLFMYMASSWCMIVYKYSSLFFYLYENFKLLPGLPMLLEYPPYKLGVFGIVKCFTI